MRTAIGDLVVLRGADWIPAANQERPAAPVFLKGWEFPPFSDRSKAQPDLVALSVRLKSGLEEGLLPGHGSRTSYSQHFIRLLASCIRKCSTVAKRVIHKWAALFQK